jgi:hypothetical protein
MPTYQQLLGSVRVERLLEIGIWQGQSLRLWRELFPEALIIGVDHNPDCTGLASDRIVVAVADQANPDQMSQVAVEWEPFDVVIDDGSHRPADVLVSFAALFPHVRGWYFIEDLPGDESDRVVDELSAYGPLVFPSDYPDTAARTLIAVPGTLTPPSP